MPANAHLKLYGAAAFERALDEFAQAMRLVRFPEGTRCRSCVIPSRRCVDCVDCTYVAMGMCTVHGDRVANVLLAHRANGACNPLQQAAQDIAQHTASVRCDAFIFM